MKDELALILISKYLKRHRNFQHVLAIPQGINDLINRSANSYLLLTVIIKNSVGVIITNQVDLYLVVKRRDFSSQ